MVFSTQGERQDAGITRVSVKDDLIEMEVKRMSSCEVVNTLLDGKGIRPVEREWRATYEQKEEYFASSHIFGTVAG